MTRIIFISFVFVACAKPETVECSAELVCPVDTICAHLTAPDADICATADQVSACATAAEGDECTYPEAPPSWCHDGVCIASVCGNARLDRGEVCDDGNTVAGDGTCSGDCASTEVCGNSIIDPLTYDSDGNPIANESCDDGNRISSDGCSSTCKVEFQRWVQLGQRPVPLVGASTAYDSVRRRLMMFGGERELSGDIATNGLYEWNGADWSKVPTVGGPAGRRNAGMVYDAARRKLVVFAGTYGSYMITPIGDLWEWDGAHWTLRTFATAPRARARFGMVYDSARKKTVIFGGVASGPTGEVPLDDTWEYDGTTWTQITSPTHPAARMGPVMAYDPRRGVTVMAGGYDGNVTHRRDTWEYDGAWRQITTATTPSDLDHGSTMAFDPATGNMITFGGEVTPNEGTYTVSNRTLSYNGTSWTALAATQPGTLRQVALGTDIGAGKIVLFGGSDQNSLRSGNTWLWNGTAWVLAPPFVPPSLRNSATAHDPLRGVTWLFGGQTDSEAPTNHLWSFDGLTWKRHLAAGPTARMMASAAVDPLLNQLVVFGGAVYDANQRFIPTTGETWVFDGSTWTSVTPSTTPAPRFGATAYFDPNRGRIVLHGGAGVSLVPFGDMWEWTGTTWQPIAATGPSSRGFASAAFDAARDSSVLWGGFSLDATSNPVVLTDTWRFDGTDWTLATPLNPMPRRIWSDLAYDPTGRHVTMFGGMDLGATGFGDTWQWNGAAWDPVLTMDSPPSRGMHAAFPANDGRGIVIFGGSDDPDGGGNAFADTWRLRYENEELVEQCLLNVDDDGDGLTGCDDDDCWAYCEPLCPPGGTCEPTAPHCGDGTCNSALESCRNCPQDCATCAAACGDSFCDAPETLATCVGDCTP